MAGWNLKAGAITEYVVSDDRIWSLFNFVFSDACKKRMLLFLRISIQAI